MFFLSHWKALRMTMLGLWICLLGCCVIPTNGFQSGDSFSLSAYQRERAQQTSDALDGSRFHFQILFVDRDNSSARIAEGLFSRIAEYNDALFTLFPFSSTLSDSTTPRDAKPSDVAVAVCESLQLCSTSSTAMGTSFDLSYLDEYDLIVAMDDSIRSQILRCLESDDDQDYYAPKCRLLSDFLSPDFSFIHENENNENDKQDNEDLKGREQQKTADNDSDEEGKIQLVDMLDEDLFERIEPFSSMVVGRSSDIFTAPLTWEEFYEPRMVLNEDTGAAVANPNSWAQTEAAMIIASVGITRFCLDTMDLQFESAFQSLLNDHFCREEHVSMTFDAADAQLRRSSNAITGYFSPRQREERFEKHIQSIKGKFI